jgi:hypothetical protein
VNRKLDGTLAGAWKPTEFEPGVLAVPCGMEKYPAVEPPDVLKE